MDLYLGSRRLTSKMLRFFPSNTDPTLVLILEDGGRRHKSRAHNQIMISLCRCGQEILRGGKFAGRPECFPCKSERKRIASRERYFSLKKGV